MTELMEDILKDDISALISKIKTEEELKMLETPEDMPEVARNLHLLRRGNPLQKLAVIQNLARIVKEPKANEQVFPLLINSIFIYDKQLQQECAIIFQNDEVLKAMTIENKRYLLKQAIEIFNSTDAQLFSKLYLEWINVCSKIFNHLSINLINNSMLELLKELNQPRNSLRYRKNGQLLLSAVICAKQSEAWESANEYKQLVYSMLTDRNWRIRRQYCIFMFKAFAPLKEFEMPYAQQLTIIKQDSYSLNSFNRSSFVRSNTLKSEIVSKRARDVYNLFKQGWASSIFEILTDSEPQVVIEGLNVMQEYHFVFKRKNFVDYFKPHFERTLTNVSLETAKIQLKKSFAKLSGLFLHRLDQLEMLQFDHKVKLFAFFKQCILSEEAEDSFENAFSQENEDSDFETVLKEIIDNQSTNENSLPALAMFNLPCFFQYIRTQENEVENSTPQGEKSSGKKNLKSKQTNYSDELLSLTLTLCKPEKPFIVQKILASCFHELLALKPDYLSLKKLLKIFSYLVKASESHQSLIEIIANNVGKITENFLINVDCLMYISKLSKIKQRSTSNIDLPKYFETESFDDESRNPRLQFYKSSDQPNGDQDGFNQSTSPKLIGNLPQALDKIVPLNAIPINYYNEIACSDLLQQLQKFFKIMIARPGNSRKDLDLFLNTLGPKIELFNACQVDQLFTKMLISILPVQSKRIKYSVFTFLAHLLQAHYSVDYKNNLIKLIIEKFAQGKSIAEKCQFIMFCECSARTNDETLFQEHFLPEYLSIPLKEKQQGVLKFFLNSIQNVWSTVRKNCSSNIVIPFADMVQNLTKKTVWPDHMKDNVMVVVSTIRGEHVYDIRDLAQKDFEATRRIERINARLQVADQNNQKKIQRDAYEYRIKNNIKQEIETQKLLKPPEPQGKQFTRKQYQSMSNLSPIQLKKLTKKVSQQQKTFKTMKTVQFQNKLDVKKLPMLTLTKQSNSSKAFCKQPTFKNKDIMQNKRKTPTKSVKSSQSQQNITDFKGSIGQGAKEENKMQVIEEYKEEGWTNSSSSDDSLKSSNFGSETSRVNLQLQVPTITVDSQNLSRIIEKSENSDTNRNPDSKEKKLFEGISVISQQKTEQAKPINLETQYQRQSSGFGSLAEQATEQLVVKISEIDSDDSEELQPWKQSMGKEEGKKSVEKEANSNRNIELEERTHSDMNLFKNNAQLIRLNKKFGSQRSLMTSRFQGLPPPPTRKESSLAAILQRANTNHKSDFASAVAAPAFQRTKTNITNSSNQLSMMKRQGTFSLEKTLSLAQIVEQVNKVKEDSFPSESFESSRADSKEPGENLLKKPPSSFAEIHEKKNPLQILVRKGNLNAIKLPNLDHQVENSDPSKDGVDLQISETVLSSNEQHEQSNQSEVQSFAHLALQESSPISQQSIRLQNQLANSRPPSTTPLSLKPSSSLSLLQHQKRKPISDKSLPTFDAQKEEEKESNISKSPRINISHSDRQSRAPLILRQTPNIEATFKNSVELNDSGEISSNTIVEIPLNEDLQSEINITGVKQGITVNTDESNVIKLFQEDQSVKFNFSYGKQRVFSALNEEKKQSRNHIVPLKIVKLSNSLKSIEQQLGLKRDNKKQNDFLLTTQIVKTTDYFSSSKINNAMPPRLPALNYQLINHRSTVPNDQSYAIQLKDKLRLKYLLKKNQSTEIIATEPAMLTKRERDLISVCSLKVDFSEKLQSEFKRRTVSCKPQNYFQYASQNFLSLQKQNFIKFFSPQNKQKVNHVKILSARNQEHQSVNEGLTKKRRLNLVNPANKGSSGNKKSKQASIDSRLSQRSAISQQKPIESFPLDIDEDQLIRIRQTINKVSSNVKTRGDQKILELSPRVQNIQSPQALRNGLLQVRLGMMSINNVSAPKALVMKQTNFLTKQLMKSQSCISKIKRVPNQVTLVRTGHLRHESKTNAGILTPHFQPLDVQKQPQTLILHDFPVRWPLSP